MKSNTFASLPILIWMVLTLFCANAATTVQAASNYELELLQKGYTIKGEYVFYSETDSCLIALAEQGKCGPKKETLSLEQLQKGSSSLWSTLAPMLILSAALLIVYLYLRRKAFRTQKKKHSGYNKSS